MNFDPLGDDIMLESTISSLYGIPITTTLDTLKSYSKGGFLKPRKPNEKSECHIGTLLIDIPSSFQGGQSILRRGHEEMGLDWSTSKPILGEMGKLQWVFFSLDVEHEVRPVTDGHRLSLSYDVYRVQSKNFPLYIIPKNVVVNPKSLPTYSAFAACLNNADFLPYGGRLAFGLDHEYPVTSTDWMDRFHNYLRGSDAALAHAFEGLEIEFKLMAVHKMCWGSQRKIGDEGEDQGNAKPVFIDLRGSMSHEECLLTGTSHRL